MLLVRGYECDFVLIAYASDRVEYHCAAWKTAPPIATVIYDFTSCFYYISLLGVTIVAHQSNIS